MGFSLELHHSHNTDLLLIKNIYQFHLTQNIWHILSSVKYYTTRQKTEVNQKHISLLLCERITSSEATKINFQDAKPNLKPPCLFQSSQLGITKLQCFNCNSSRSSRRRVGEMTDELRNFEQVMQKGVGEGLRYNSTLCGKK